MGQKHKARETSEGQGRGVKKKKSSGKKENKILERFTWNVRPNKERGKGENKRKQKNPLEEWGSQQKKTSPKLA